MAIRKTFLKKQKLNGEMSLQITSMADIFMILLVFLLKSFGSGTIDATPSAGLVMPKAVPGSVPVDGLKVEVGETWIRVEGRKVADISGYSFEKKDIAGTGASKILSTVLKTQRETQPETRVIVLADQRAPYATIKTVIASAAVSGYTDFKLAVVNPH